MQRITFHHGRLQVCYGNGDYEYKNFPELSYYAWKISEQVNQEKAVSAEKKASKAAFLRWFNPLIQALRDLGGSATPVEARNKIIEMNIFLMKKSILHGARTMLTSLKMKLHLLEIIWSMPVT